MTDIFSYLQTDATRFVSKVGATAWGSSSGSGNIGSLAIPTNQLIVQPFFVGLESITLTACGVQAVGGAGTNTVQFGIYNVLAPTARDVYPKTLVAEANTLSIAANGIAWSSGWATGSPVLTNGLYYLAALVGGAGTRSLSSTVDSDATFWLGSDTALNRGYMGFFTAHTAGTPLPSTFPLGATLFTNLDSYRIYVGMR